YRTEPAVRRDGRCGELSHSHVPAHHRPSPTVWHLCRLREDRFRHAGFHQLRELVGHQRPAEIVALSLTTPLALQERELRSRFHAFGDDPMPEAPAHADHGTDD